MVEEEVAVEPEPEPEVVGRRRGMPEGPLPLAGLWLERESEATAVSGGEGEERSGLGVVGLLVVGGRGVAGVTRSLIILSGGVLSFFAIVPRSLLYGSDETVRLN